jgi:NADH dehydrogenase [ubiquinone] 1 alpha subcomplex assembly factor 6
LANTQQRPRRTGAIRPSRGALLSYCAEQVRTHHPERYLATLVAPAERREALFALYAFDQEIAKVRHLVHEPMAGLIRLQWWREVLAEIDAGAPPRAHPVVEGLARALSAEGMAQARLPARLDAAIEARERELEDPPPADLEAFERHLGASSATITLAALDLLGAGSDAARQAGGWSGLALGLADALRTIPLDARRRRLFLPGDALGRHGVDSESVFRGQAEPALRALIRDLGGRARAHLDKARDDRAAVPRHALPALLPGTLAGSWLARLARAGHDPFALPRRASALAPLRLLWYRSTGRF